MSGEKMLKDDNGVNTVMEYILVFIMAMLVFTVFISSSQSIFVDGPSKMVSKNQFMDVGNDIDTKLIDTYLVAPQNGSIYTTFDLPYDIAGHGYIVEVSDVIVSGISNGDKEVTINSDHYTDVFVKLTLNGVNSTVPILGNTSSHNAVHTISYTH